MSGQISQARMLSNGSRSYEYLIPPKPMNFLDNHNQIYLLIMVLKYLTFLENVISEDWRIPSRPNAALVSLVE